MNNATIHCITKVCGGPTAFSKLISISPKTLQNYTQNPPKRKCPDYVADKIVKVGQDYAAQMPGMLVAVKQGEPYKYWLHPTTNVQRMDNAKTELAQLAYLQSGKFMVIEYAD